MPGLVVVNGARIECNRCPGAQSSLAVAGAMQSVHVEGQPAATVDDHRAGENIEPFPATCQATKKACSPQTPLPWMPGETSALLPSLTPLVSESSVLICTKGFGVIQILDPGQSTMEVSPPAGNECKPPPEPKWYEQLLDTVTFADVANAPSRHDCPVDSKSDKEQVLDFVLMVTPLKAARVAKLMKIRRRARRAAATGAATIELAVSRSAAVLAARERARRAALRLAQFLARHEITVGPDGTLTSENPKKQLALTVAQEALKTVSGGG